MRFDRIKGIVTLEEDIIRLWKLHSWRVLEERVRGNTWTIKAEPVQRKQKKKARGKAA